MAFHYSPKIVSNGLIFKLDAANHKSYPGSGTTWTDLSGNSNDGTLTNGPTFNTDKAGNIVFDGVNDWADCGPIKPTGAMTISSWHKGDVYINTHQAGRGDTAGYALKSTIDTPNTRIQFLFRIPVEGSTTVFISGFVTTNTSLWYNLVGVYIPSTSITTYLNGNQIFQNTTSIPASQFVGNTSNTRINKDGGTNYQAGSVADVSIYDIALTPTQILKNYNATKSRFGL